jgi:small neutral amino acid transporter SnatA (MarC family)
MKGILGSSIALLVAANPAIITSVFLLWTKGFGKNERLKFIHTSMPIALVIALCFTFVIWLVAVILDVIISIFTFMGGIVLFYITIKSVFGDVDVNDSKHCNYKSLFSFASPVVVGPATVTVTSDSVVVNGLFETLALLFAVVTIIWLTLFAATKLASKRTQKRTKRSWANWVSRFMYIPIGLLSIWMIVKGALGAFRLLA